MAYNKDEIYKQATELSKKMGFFFVQDLIDYLCISKPTFYDFFPPDSNELNYLKENLYKNRIVQKISLRKKMSEGRSTDLIALYKLIGNDYERKVLSNNPIIEEKDNTVIFNFGQKSLTIEDLKEKDEDDS